MLQITNAMFEHLYYRDVRNFTPKQGEIYESGKELAYLCASASMYELFITRKYTVGLILVACVKTNNKLSDETNNPLSSARFKISCAPQIKVTH